MTKYTVKFTNFNGEEVTEDLYFHISEDELVKLSKVDPTFTQENITQIAEEKDGRTMYAVIQKILTYAFGVKSEDGWYFDKDCPKAKNFPKSAAFEALMSDLIEIDDPDMFTKFFEGIFAAGILAKARKAQLSVVDSGNK